MTRRKKRRAPRPNLWPDPFQVFLDGVEELLQDRTECRKKVRIMVAAAKARAKKKGIPFKLSRAAIMELQIDIERGTCALTGRPFAPGPFAASLDRIDPVKGYVDGNVRVICKLMNFALGNWGEAVLREVMAAWLKDDHAAPPPYRLIDQWGAGLR